MKFKPRVSLILFFILNGGDVDQKSVVGEIGFAREKLGFPFLHRAEILERQFLILSPLDRREILTVDSSHLVLHSERWRF